MDLNTDMLVLATQIMMGIGLAAACGLRAFLPIFATGAFSRVGYLELGSTFDWIGSTPALIVFGSAVVVEILSDKFPYVDNALDTAALVVKPLAGALLASAAIVDMDPVLAAVVGLITGGSVTGVVHTAKAGARIVSTATTGGIANPFLSVAEDAGGIALTVLAIVFPLLAMAALLVMSYLTYRVIRRLRRRPAPVPVPARLP